MMLKDEKKLYNKYRIIDGIVYERIDVNYYDCILGTELERELPSHKKVKIKILILILNRFLKKLKRWIVMISIVKQK